MLENCGINNVGTHEIGISNKVDAVDMKVTQHNSGMSTLEFNPDRIRTRNNTS